jgi:GT2 family glycosyltransferase
VTTPVLSAIVVSYRKDELLEHCLLSAQAALREIDGSTELVVILNGASKDERFSSEERFEGIDIVYEPENIGFAPAVGKGVRRARSEWVALLNDDATVEPQAFARMLAAGTSATDVGSVAAQMRFSDRPQIINSAGIEVDRLGVAYDRLLGQPLSTSETETVEVFGASGGSAIYRRAMLDDIGGFDESFFAYLEDVDVAWRARMKGWRCLYVPSAVVFHHHSATLGHGSERKYYLVGRNRVRLLAKNASSAQLRRYGLWMLANDLAYVTFVALMKLTLAPLRGRFSGLREWKRYRRAGAENRRAIPLVRVSGVRAALRRQRAWKPGGIGS